MERAVRERYAAVLFQTALKEQLLALRSAIMNAIQSGNAINLFLTEGMQR